MKDGFYKNQTSCQQEDKGRKKTLADIHEDNSTVPVLSFSSFVRPWLWGNVLPWMAHPFYGLQIQYVGLWRTCRPEDKQARWQTCLIFYLQDKHPFSIITFFLIWLKRFEKKKKETLAANNWALYWPYSHETSFVVFLVHVYSWAFRLPLEDVIMWIFAHASEASTNYLHVLCSSLLSSYWHYSCSKSIINVNYIQFIYVCVIVKVCSFSILAYGNISTHISIWCEE